MPDYMTPNEVRNSIAFGKKLAERIAPINGGRFEIAAAFKAKRDRMITDWLWLQLCDKQKPRSM